MNLRGLPEFRAAQNPEGPALADDHVSLNNREFLEAVLRASASLREHGVSGGDVVAAMLPNTVGLVVSLFAAWRMGAAVTPINPSLRPMEVGYQLSDADAKVLIVDTAPEFDTGLRPVITANDMMSTPDAGRLGPTHLADDSLALLIYTSGTTGRPKGVMLDHSNLIAMCRGVIDAFAMTSQIERFAPGFRDRVVGQAVRSTTQMASYNANFVGGDIMTGAKDLRQLTFGPRITLSPYRVGVPGMYICSAATPPGPGAHGMCGYNAAESALTELNP